MVGNTLSSSGASSTMNRIVPNYELAPALEKVEILRVVVRENMSAVVCFVLASARTGKFTDHVSAH
jgi:hypothetical protein